MNLKKNIPNTITLGNLFCGCLALIKAFEGDLVWASYLVGISLVLDFFDGFTARLLKVSSPIGKDLDSLADMVTFGVVPGMVMYHLIGSTLIDHIVVHSASQSTTYTSSPVPYIALVIPVFSCIRLAKFNNDTRQTDSFIGLNTPSNTMVICSLPLIAEFQPQLSGINGLIHNPLFLSVLSIAMSLLMVSELPFFALKFKGFGWSSIQNRLRFVFLGLALILLVTLHFVAIPLIILLYILLSIVNNIFLKKKV